MQKYKCLFYSLLIAGLSTGCAQVQTNSLAYVAVPDAPKSAGPYSQGVVVDGMLYSAGMTARDPVSNTLVQGDITTVSNRIFDNLEAILRGSGSSFRDVVKVTVYMTDLSDFSKMNEAMAARFGDSKPARTTIQAAKLPGGATLEIDVVAKSHK